MIISGFNTDYAIGFALRGELIRELEQLEKNTSQQLIDSNSFSSRKINPYGIFGLYVLMIGSKPNQFFSNYFNFVFFKG